MHDFLVTPTLSRSLCLGLAWLFVCTGMTAVVVHADEDRGVQQRLYATMPEQKLPGLEAMLKQGLAGGASILRQRLEAAQADANARVARAPMLPYFYASVNAGRILEQREQGSVTPGVAPVPIDDRKIDALLYNVGVSQPIFHWGALYKTFEMARIQRAISERNVLEMQRTLAIDIRRRYMELINMACALANARTAMARYEIEKDYIDQQIKDGFASSETVGLVAGKITATRLGIQRLEADIETYGAALRRMVGLPEGADLMLAGELPPVDDLKKILDGMTLASPGTDSFRVQNLADSVRSERLNYAVIKTRTLPKFGFNFYVSQDDRNPDNNVLGAKQLLTSWNAFATVNWTIFDGLGTRASKQVSAYRIRSLEADLTQAEREERDQRCADLANLRYNWESLQLGEQGLAGARLMLTEAEKNFQAGWASKQGIEDARLVVNTAVYGASLARATFYLSLATYFSNRGEDPALRSSAP